MDKREEINLQYISLVSCVFFFSQLVYTNNLDRVRICYFVSPAYKLSYSKIMLVV